MPPVMTAVALLKQWPDTAAIAHDLGLSYYTVAAWLRRDSIPVVHWEALAQAARVRGLRRVSFAKFHAAAISKNSKPAPMTKVKADSAAPAQPLRNNIKDAPVIVQYAQAGTAGKNSSPSKRKHADAA